MTYCVAMRLNRGLVFAADTRTSAGSDNVATFCKLYFWRKPGQGCWCCARRETSPSPSR